LKNKNFLSGTPEFKLGEFCEGIKGRWVYLSAVSLKRINYPLAATPQISLLTFPQYFLCPRRLKAMPKYSYPHKQMLRHRKGVTPKISTELRLTKRKQLGCARMLKKWCRNGSFLKILGKESFRRPSGVLPKTELSQDTTFFPLN
jgi:hypothetical protein